VTAFTEDGIKNLRQIIVETSRRPRPAVAQTYTPGLAGIGVGPRKLYRTRSGAEIVRPIAPKRKAV
jgi:hypothetical protein